MKNTKPEIKIHRARKAGRATAELKQVNDSFEDGDRIAVCAGNYEQFCTFMDLHSQPDKVYIYAEWKNLIGRRLHGYLIYGTFYKRKDRDDIFREVKSRIIK